MFSFSELLVKKQDVWGKLEKIEKHIQGVLGDDYTVGVEITFPIFDVISVGIFTKNNRSDYEIKNNDHLSIILHTIGPDLLLSLLEDRKNNYKIEEVTSGNGLFDVIISKNKEVEDASLAIKNHVLNVLNSNEDGDEYTVRVYLSSLDEWLEIEIYEDDGGSFERLIEDNETLENIMKLNSFKELLGYLLFSV